MGILLVYDVTDERSFNSMYSSVSYQCISYSLWNSSDIHTWHSNIEQHASEGVNKILIGNKSDWTDKKAVTEEQGRELANELGIKFMETSAKVNEGVEEAFFTLARYDVPPGSSAQMIDLIHTGILKPDLSILKQTRQARREVRLAKGPLKSINQQANCLPDVVHRYSFVSPYCYYGALVLSLCLVLSLSCSIGIHVPFATISNIKHSAISAHHSIDIEMHKTRE